MAFRSHLPLFSTPQLLSFYYHKNSDIPTGVMVKLLARFWRWFKNKFFSSPPPVPEPKVTQPSNLEYDSYDKGGWFNGWLSQNQTLSESGKYSYVNKTQFDQEAINFEPNLAQSEFQEIYFKQGNLWIDLGRYEEAIISYEKAIEIKPDDDIPWSSRGYALNKLGRYEEAIASHEKAIEIKPDDYISWSSRGYALNKLGRHEEEITSYDQALQIKLDDYLAWYNRADAAYKSSGYNLPRLKLTNPILPQQN